MCPKPGKSWRIQPPRPRTKNTRPTINKTGLVTNPTPRRAIPNANTMGHAVA
jgi:hypothetical protein